MMLSECTAVAKSIGSDTLCFAKVAGSVFVVYSFTCFYGILENKNRHFIGFESFYILNPSICK